MCILREKNSIGLERGGQSHSCEIPYDLLMSFSKTSIETAEIMLIRGTIVVKEHTFGPFQRQPKSCQDMNTEYYTRSQLTNLWPTPVVSGLPELLSLINIGRKDK